MHYSDAAYCVISGDILNRGTDTDYAAVAKALSALRVPVLPMVGNHDDRKLFIQHLPLPTGLDGFVQYAVETTDGLIICLDTLDQGKDSGAFCETRAAWLREILAQGKPACIFMHHPPAPLGLPMQDQDRLADGDACLELLADYPNVAQLLIGHVHRPIAGHLRSIPFATMRSVTYQAPPPTPAWDWASFAPADECPAMGVITWQADGCLVHYHDITAAGPSA